MNKKMMIILAVTALLFGGVGIGASSFMHKGGKAEETHKKKKKDSDEAKHTVALDDFVVNLADTDPLHYLKSSVTLEVDDPELDEKIKAATPEIRDAVITLMSRHTFADLQKVQGKEALKSAIKKKINELLGDDSVTSIYFTAFAMQ